MRNQISTSYNSEADLSSLSPENYVVVRMWPPKKSQQIISYPEALLRVTLGKTDTCIGHASIAIHHNKSVTYISLWPNKNTYLTKTPGQNHTLEQDIKDENMVPYKQIVLYSLDTDKMLEFFNKIRDCTNWFIAGNKHLWKKTEETSYNCSSYVYHLLEEGGLFNHLLDENEKLSEPMTPVRVASLAEKANLVEKTLHPETEIFLLKNKEIFKRELLKRSQEELYPCSAINDYLKENSDYYLNLHLFKPDEFDALLSEMYRNIQENHNRHLLQIAEKNDAANKEPNFHEQIDNLLNLGANLNCHNAKGENALHCLIRKGDCEAVSKLLTKFNNAVNSEILPSDSDKNKMEFKKRNKFLPPRTPLDLAIDIGNAKMITLLKAHGGKTKNRSDDAMQNHLFATMKQKISSVKQKSLQKADQLVHLTKGVLRHSQSSFGLFHNNNRNGQINCDNEQKVIRDNLDNRDNRDNRNNYVLNT